MTKPGYVALGAVLTATAGFIDAVGFFELGSVFVSFMSGNTTRLGAGLVVLSAGDAGLLSFLLLMFLTGSTLGSLIAGSNPRWGSPLILGTVTLLLGAVLLLDQSVWAGNNAIAFVPLAMGAQNAALRPSGAAKLGATYVTGTLFSVGHDLAGALLGTAPRWRWLQHLIVWGALLTGAITGAALYAGHGLAALYLPLALYAGLATALAFTGLRRPDQS